MCQECEAGGSGICAKIHRIHKLLDVGLGTVPARAVQCYLAGVNWCDPVK